jgi:hypothetical protein
MFDPETCIFSFSTVAFDVEILCNKVTAEAGSMQSGVAFCQQSLDHGYLV